MELFTPDFGLVFWMFIAFILLFLVLAKWGWPVIIKMMDSRAATIDQGVEDAKQAKEQLDNAREEAKKYVVEAQARQAEMLRDAARMKTEIIEQAKNEAADAARKEMDAAKAAIEQARKEAELQFRNEVGRFSIDIAEKMVRNQMKSDKAQTELVNKLLDEIEKN
ncbi:ATP synthase F0 subunit B [Muribaculaceae bacterium Isolate-113 (HZI)]|jgi:F-type H+-transporting ATPase subunit b|uniref:F0F1 ATP synthase subunit B n=1 Tax=Bacteroidales TaxID=171549 RepID=UPI000F493918|nr:MULTISPECIES: F0F1 ATP synthase subunit B [Bacteroidales]MBJ2191797.1 F0F1 ATP synthase subunit B [Muribaculaceae bacterium]ROS82737.1 ATP synthase F0 subunit B [Muribaculaceae bacterium Isolate-036 (Harlan)]ROT20515.1 ATP synthase F0 subunit B [Muribaculaceae bacterium Isolate-114 (HZI)]ROT23229.1 ATP synthase F0 subunit B [Muribaculaceae bacterium Isolate-113 (HZI)]RXE66028.1 ATP synthase F0 subunit B [Muribaculaceae bacterium Isolate-001 (NCI)]